MSVPGGPQGPYYPGGQQSGGAGSYGQPYDPSQGQPFSPAGQQPYGQPAMQAAAPYQATGADFSGPPRNQRPWLIPVIAIATFALGVSVGLLTKPDPPIPAPTPVPPVTVTETSQPPPVQVTVTTTARWGSTTETSQQTPFGDGIWQIGTQVAVGNYAATVPSGSTCYVTLLRSKNENDIITKDTAEAGSRLSLRVTAGAAYVQSRGCGTWVPAS